MAFPEPEPDRGTLRRFAAVVGALVLVIGLMTASYQLGLQRAGATGPAPSLGPTTVEPSGETDAEGFPEELAPVVELYEELTDEAVSVPDPGALVEGALEGMVEALDDPYASYYDAAAYEAFNQQLDGSFSGVGLLLEETPEGLVVVTVFEDTPAAKAGVRQGERVVSVDGRDVQDLPIDEVVDMVKGEEGTEVTLGLAGEGGVREVTMTRQEIAIPQLTTSLLDSGAGHVQLVHFSQGAAEEVRAAVADLLGEGAQGIVLDLRGNPGGLLSEAVGVASVFIEDGPIVSVQERANEREVLRARGDAYENVPLVVLVDEGSASASEIVAGAIQDAGRAEIVGQTTFGKGTVQTIQPLANGAGVKFTTARYFTPSGDSIEEIGITPDRVVAGPDEQLAVAQERLRALVAER